MADVKVLPTHRIGRAELESVLGQNAAVRVTRWRCGADRVLGTDSINYEVGYYNGLGSPETFFCQMGRGCSLRSALEDAMRRLVSDRRDGEA